ncbi:MAG: nucleotidyltransferase family protein [Pseudomonadota bacterium]
MGHIVGVLLCAGASSRMGRADKLLAPLGCRPLIAHAAETLVQSPLTSLVAVLPPGAAALNEALDTAAPQIARVINPDPASGIGRSLALGVQALEATKPDGIAVFLGDMPFIRPQTVMDLVAVFQASDGSCVVRPTLNGQPGHPVVWPGHAIPLLKTLTGEAGGQSLRNETMFAWRDVQVADEGVTFDVDTPGSLAQARRRLAKTQR